MQHGHNPRTEWDIDWEDRLKFGEPVSVMFEPFHGLWPAFCECYAVKNGYAVLLMPDSEVNTHYKEPSNWIPCDKKHWAIVPETYLRPQ